MCKGNGFIKVSEIETPGDKNSLPGTLDKLALCSSCNGNGYVKVNIDNLKELKELK